jgi:hypothetical protein
VVVLSTAAALPLASSSCRPTWPCLRVGAGRRPLASTAATTTMRASAASSSSSSSSPPPRFVASARLVATRIDVGRLLRRAVAQWGLSDADYRVDKEWVLIRVRGAEAPSPTHTATTTDGGIRAGDMMLSVSRRGAVVSVVGPSFPAHELSSSSARYSLEPFLRDPAICPGPPLEQRGGGPPAFVEELGIVLEAPDEGEGEEGGERRRHEHDQLGSPKPLPPQNSAAPAPSGGGGGATIISDVDNDGRDDDDDVHDDGFSRVDRLGDLHVTSRELGWDAVRLVNAALAQSTTLSFYEAEAEALSAVVRGVNAGLQDGSSPSSSDRKRLYRHLADVSKVSSALILSKHLARVVRPGTRAWSDERLARLYDRLDDLFEIEDRVEAVRTQVEFLTESIKYALDAERSAHSLRLEKLIVLLITAELAISVLHTSLGEAAVAAAAGAAEAAGLGRW